MIITRRWKHKHIISGQDFDLIELDSTYYVFVPNVYDNNEIVDKFNSGEYIEKYTYEQVEELRGSHENFMVLYGLLQKLKAKCECGSDSVPSTQGLHDWWCPRYGSDM